MAEKSYPKIEDMSFKEASIELEQIVRLRTGIWNSRSPSHAMHGASSS